MFHRTGSLPAGCPSQFPVKARSPVRRTLPAAPAGGRPPPATAWARRPPSQLHQPPDHTVGVAQVVQVIGEDRAGGRAQRRVGRERLRRRRGAGSNGPWFSIVTQNRNVGCWARRSSSSIRAATARSETNRPSRAAPAKLPSSRKASNPKSGAGLVAPVILPVVRVHKDRVIPLRPQVFRQRARRGGNQRAVRIAHVVGETGQAHPGQQRILRPHRPAAEHGHPALAEVAGCGGPLPRNSPAAPARP